MNKHKIHLLVFVIVIGLIFVGCLNRPPVIMATDQADVTHLNAPTPNVGFEENIRPTYPPYPFPYPYPAVTSTPFPFQSAPYPPPSVEAKQGNLPNLPADLLYLDARALMYWPRGADYLETIAGPDQEVLGHVFMYAFHDLTRELALVLKNEPTGYKIVRVNLYSRESTTLVDIGINVPLQMAFSPDGNWLAYILPDTSPDAHCRLETLHSGADPVYVGQDCGGTIYFLPVAAPAQVKKIAVCAEKIFTDDESKTVCDNLIWSLDSQTLYWGDVYGIWQMETEGSAPLLINASKLNQFLPETETYAYYQFEKWSPDGRYLTLEIQYMDSWGWAVFDSQEGTLSGLPGVWPYSIQRLTWLQDGNLLSLQPYTITNNTTLTGIIWQIDAENQSGLVQETEFSLPFPVSPVVNFPFAPQQWPDGRVSFAIANMFGSEYQQRGLYFMNLADFTLQKVNGLPPSALSINFNFISYNEPIYWAPDGAGAIYNYYYIPSDGSPIYFLGNLFRNPIDDFTWITP